MVEMISSVFWVITWCKVVWNDISGLPIDPIFKGQAVKKEAKHPMEKQK